MNNNDIFKVKIGMRNATLSYKSTFALAQQTRRTSNWIVLWKINYSNIISACNMKCLVFNNQNSYVVSTLLYTYWIQCSIWVLSDKFMLSKYIVAWHYKFHESFLICASHLVYVYVMTFKFVEFESQFKREMIIENIWPFFKNATI